MGVPSRLRIPHANKDLFFSDVKTATSGDSEFQEKSLPLLHVVQQFACYLNHLVLFECFPLNCRSAVYTEEATGKNSFVRFPVISTDVNQFQRTNRHDF